MPPPHTPVLIVGAGPVGLALAGDLGWRGVPCTLIEKTDGRVEHPKMDLIGVRTMEFCRRWGIADRVRDAPYPPDYPQDYVWLHVAHRLRARPREIPRPRLRGAARPRARRSASACRRTCSIPSSSSGRRSFRASRCSTTPSWSASRTRARRCARPCATRDTRRDARDHRRLHDRHRRRRLVRARDARHPHERAPGAHLHHQRDLPLPGLRHAARQGQGLPLHLHRAGRHLADDRGDQRRRPLPHVDRRHAGEGGRIRRTTSAPR